jgi:hypothetical protein
VNRTAAAARAGALALAACATLVAWPAGSARAEGRFGDSTWVAPASPDAGDSSASGPRVAERDRERGWESALRAPFRVVFYPLHLLANGYEGGIGVLGPRYLDPKAPHPPRTGPVFAPAISAGALNDIGIGPALTWSGRPASGSMLKVSGTWSAVDHRRAHASWTIAERHAMGFRLRAGYERKPDVRYYGVGNSSQAARVSYHRLAETQVEAALLLGRSPLRRLAVEAGYSAMTPDFDSGYPPATGAVFTPEEAPFAHESTRYLGYGLAGDLASLDDVRNPSRGLHGRFRARRWAGVGASDPGYDQWNLEGRAYLPVFAKRRVLAVRAVYAGVDPGRFGEPELPLDRLARSEGASRFAGYSSNRFRDRQLVHTRIEYRWEIFHGVSALALYDAGEVQPRTGLFRLGDAHTSYGGGLRMGLSDIATLRGELARSAEGMHAVLILGGDF